MTVAYNYDIHVINAAEVSTGEILKKILMDSSNG